MGDSSLLEYVTTQAQCGNASKG